MNPVINYLALDIGSKRIGVARANSVARLPEPLQVIPNDPDFRSQLDSIIAEYGADEIIVGLPRSLDGNETDQSQYTRAFVSDNFKNLPVKFQDETISSVEAEKRMKIYGLQNRPDMLDAVAACIILEDYMNYESN